MKIISLNCWGGKLYDQLIRFIQDQNEKIDIFCFQEMIFGGPDEVFSHHNLRGQLFERIKEILLEYNSYTLPSPRKSIFGLDGYELGNGAKIGQAIFIKKMIAVSGVGSFLANPPGRDPFKNLVTGHITGVCQHLDFKINGQDVVLVNIHGLWQREKDDTAERLEQSQKVIEFINNKNLPAVLLGDFNLRPKTQSIAMLGEILRNLISEYKVAKTRTRFYADMQKYKDYIADYAFVSPKISLINFQVLEDEVSDHLPLFLEFDLTE